MIIKEKFPKYLEGWENGKDKYIITRDRCRNEKEDIEQRMMIGNAEYVEAEQICSIYWKNANKKHNVIWRIYRRRKKIKTDKKYKILREEITDVNLKDENEEK